MSLPERTPKTDPISLSHHRCRECARTWSTDECVATIDMLCPFCGAEESTTEIGNLSAIEGDEYEIAHPDEMKRLKHQVYALEDDLSRAESDAWEAELGLDDVRMELQSLRRRFSSMLGEAPFGPAPWKIECDCGSIVYGTGTHEECSCGQVHLARRIFSGKAL